MEVKTEQLSKIRFPTKDVLSCAQKQDERMRMIKHAVLAGNLYKTTSIIEFQSNQGLCSITSTIWHFTEDYIVLKGGQTIPVRAIVCVK